MYREAREEEREYLFNWSARRKDKLTRKWGEISEKHTGVEMSFHDIRKVSITWLFTMGVPLEIATMLNVGWCDLNTAFDHYLELRGLLKVSKRLEYREQIPD